MTTTNPTEVEARARERAHEILGDARFDCGRNGHRQICNRTVAMVIAFDEKCDRLTEVQREATALRAEVARLTEDNGHLGCLADLRGEMARTKIAEVDRNEAEVRWQRAEAEVARLQEAVAGARAGAFREAATMVSDMQDNWRTVSDAPQVPSEKIGYGDVGGSFPARGQSAREAESTARAALRMAATKLSRLATPLTAPEPMKETE